MIYSTLISPLELSRHLSDPDWVIVDCRFSLDDPQRGPREYAAGHVSGAVYANLDEDLSGCVHPGVTGRHPLPPLDEMIETFSSMGIGDGVQVVAYDDAGGAFAARLWWMLHFCGHDAVAVLDGGWPRWIASELPVRYGEERNAPRSFRARPRHEWIVDASQVDEARLKPDWHVIDAREPERYRGEFEPIDPVAGHIPGAKSAPYRQNLDPDGTFLPPPELRRRFESIIGEAPPARVVSYCGSGVTAAHNLLAMAHAGLGYGRLYPGSWSEWITDSARPVERS